MDETFEANADSIEYERDADGNIVVVFKYVRIPAGKTSVKLTLAMPPAAIEKFAQALVARAREAPASRSRH